MGITGFGSPGAEKLKDVKEDKSGSVVMETVASGLITSVTAAGTGQTTTTATGNKNYMSMNYNITGTGGTIQFLQNGGVMDSTTGLAAGASGTLTFYSSTPPTSPTLTGKGTFNGAGTATFTFNANGLRTKSFNDFMHDVRRDVNGTVVVETAAIGLSTTAHDTGVSVTTKTTVTPERYFVSMNWTNSIGSGADIALLQNGSMQTSITNQAEGATGTLTTSNDTPLATPQSLTARYTWATLGGNGTVTSYVESYRLSTTVVTNNTSEIFTLNGTGTTVSIVAKVNASPTGTMYFSVNDSPFFTTTNPATGTYTSTTTGAFTSPSATVRGHASGTTFGAIVDTRTYKLLGPNTGEGTVSFSVNQIRGLQVA